VNQINEILGLPPYSSSKNIRRGSGINGLLQDILAVVNIDDIVALWKDKVQSSQDVKELSEWIQSPKFEVNIQQLKFMGVNLNVFFA
jgi:hypothetical protein